MATLQFPFSYERLNPIPLDASAVFDTLAAFQAYLAGPTAYAGQICAVRGGNEPALYRVNEDYTYSPLGGGGGFAVLLDNPPTVGELSPGQFGLELTEPLRLWVGVPASFDPAEVRLLIGSMGPTADWNSGVSWNDPSVVWG